MLVTLSLALPGETASVRVARHLLANVLDVLGVAQDAAFDICLALSEACTNVVEHARAAEDYRIVVELSDDTCRLTVTDTGQGFELGPLPPPLDEVGAAGAAGADGAEGGRGISMIQALTDRFGISSGPGEGVIVFLEKRLRPQVLGENRG